MLFPDTVFFSRGKPRLIVRSDREWCLMAIKNPSKLNLQQVYKDFSNVVRERKKDFAGPFFKKYGRGAVGQTPMKGGMVTTSQVSEHTTPGMQTATIEQAPRFASLKDFTPDTLQVRDKSRLRSTDIPLAQQGITDKSIYYRDIALIRYRNDDLVQVVNETGFMSTF